MLSRWLNNDRIHKQLELGGMSQRAGRQNEDIAANGNPGHQT